MSTHSAQRKSPTLYYIVVTVWAGLTTGAVYTSRSMVTKAWHHTWWVGVLVAICMPFIAYFWLNGVKDYVYTFFYHWSMKRKPTWLPASRPKNGNGQRVVMVYCTYNDFNGDSLRRCLDQTYSNYWVVILDDSTKPEYRAEVDDFADRYDIAVVRRADREGAKGGNLNNFLQSNGDWDYFVILDSDEIVPRNAVTRFLDYMVARPGVGIVQGNHRATRNRNAFMARFAPGVDSHWIAYQTVKNQYGFMSLLGHGAMVSRECYEASGGFPHVVAEDICLSIEARKAGFLTIFAPDIMCEEEFPVD